MPTKERRRDARYPFARPVKIRCDRTGKFFSGQTVNMSAGGALIHVNHPSLLVPGQRVSVGVAWTRSQEGLIASHQLLNAIVVRSLGHCGEQTVALQFAQRQQTAAVSA